METVESIDWEEVYDRFADRMLLFAKQYVGCAQTAEDIVQEGFVRFWRSRQRRAEGQMEAHLFGCVRWAALDFLRKRKRAARREMDYGKEHFGSEADDAFDCPLEETETSKLVERALQKLPVKQREVLVLRIWSGLTLQQIAEALGISINTAASRYRYAITSLRSENPLRDYATGT